MPSGTTRHVTNVNKPNQSISAMPRSRWNFAIFQTKCIIYNHEKFKYIYNNESTIKMWLGCVITYIREYTSDVLDVFCQSDDADRYGLYLNRRLHISVWDIKM